MLIKYSSISSLFLFIAGFLTQPLQGFYSYPVAVLSPHEVIMMHQNKTGERTLYTWDLDTKSTGNPLLAPYYNAALVKVLPDGSGFSFINEEMIFIKKLERRSAKRIEIDEPLYGIELLEWIDQNQCYFHAFEGDRAGLYQLSRDGDIVRLKISDIDDLLYPQVVGDQLFYIKRTNDYHYSVVVTRYPHASEEHLLVDFDHRPILLLHMLSAERGFFLEHAPMRDTNVPLFSLFFHMLIKKDNNWKTEQLFTIQIPVNLLFDQATRLYESLVPFLPFYHNNSFYFCSCKDERLAIFCYDCSTKAITLVMQASHHLLAPMVLQDYLVYGLINDSSDNPQLRYKEIIENNS